MLRYIICIILNLICFFSYYVTVSFTLNQKVQYTDAEFHDI